MKYVIADAPYRNVSKDYDRSLSMARRWADVTGHDFTVNEIDKDGNSTPIAVVKPSEKRKGRKP